LKYLIGIGVEVVKKRKKKSDEGEGWKEERFVSER
jgi:hypothetical protein